MQDKSQTHRVIRTVKRVVGNKRFIIAKAVEHEDGFRMSIVGLTETIEAAKSLADYWNCKVIAFRIEYIIEINPHASDE